MVEARHGNVYGTIGNYVNCYKLIDVVTEPPVVPGDVNGDGIVTAADVTALYQYILNGDSSAIVSGDQNNDGNITSSDVTSVYKIILGKE